MSPVIVVGFVHARERNPTTGETPPLSMTLRPARGGPDHATSPPVKTAHRPMRRFFLRSLAGAHLPRHRIGCHSGPLGRRGSLCYQVRSTNICRTAAAVVVFALLRGRCSCRLGSVRGPTVSNRRDSFCAPIRCCGRRSSRFRCKLSKPSTVAFDSIRRRILRGWMAGGMAMGPNHQLHRFSCAQSGQIPDA